MTDLYPSILERVLQEGERKSKAFCTSRQLRNGIRRETLISTATQAQGRLHVPHYWAIYYHEGRRVITPVSSTFLVWFKNPKDDPRLINGQSPVFRSDVKRLNLPPAELRRLRKAGKLFVVKRSPRSGQPKFQGNPFFSDRPGGGLAGLDKFLVQVAKEEAHRYMEEYLRANKLKKVEINVNMRVD